MCTMTWFVTDQGYELFFNRDERISRRRAERPSIQASASILAGKPVQYISPTDTDAGGTWIAVNQYAVTICLLNHYQFEQIESYKDWISRGEIVRKFAATHDLQLAEKQFYAMDLHDYRAFRMFIINREGRNRLCVWDGHTPRIECNVSSPKSSSSVDARHVKEVRRSLFQDLGLAASCQTDDYLRYHASHSPSRSKESVCMHRSDANTVSLSHVAVHNDCINFRYADGCPCQAPLGDAVSIQLQAHPGQHEQPLTAIR